MACCCIDATLRPERKKSCCFFFAAYFRERAPTRCLSTSNLSLFKSDADHFAPISFQSSVTHPGNFFTSHNFLFPVIIQLMVVVCCCQCNICVVAFFFAFLFVSLLIVCFSGDFVCFHWIRIFIGMFIFLMGFSLFGYYNKITWWLTLFIYTDAYWKGCRNSHNWLTTMRKTNAYKKVVMSMEWDDGLVQRGFSSQSVRLSQFY